MPTISDYLLRTSAVGQPGFYVQLINNLTSTAYVSTGATDANGLWTVAGVPPGTYTVSTGPTGAGPWTATGDTNYIVPIRDDANLFWDEVNLRLGIGTTTPGSKLDLGSANLGDGAQANSRLAFYDDGSNVSYVTFDAVVVTRFKSSGTPAGGPWRFTSVPSGAGRFGVGTDVFAISAVGHLLSTGATPTLGSLQAGISSQSISGTDTRFALTVTTTGAPPGVAATVAGIVWANGYASTPVVIPGQTALVTWLTFGESTSGVTIKTQQAMAGTTTYTIPGAVWG